jgi:hypothetical protein
LDSNGDYGIIVGFNKDARNKYRVFLPLANTLVTRGAFQAVDAPIQGMGLQPRLKSRLMNNSNQHAAYDTWDNEPHDQQVTEALVRQTGEGDIGIQSQLQTTTDSPHYDTQPVFAHNKPVQEGASTSLQNASPREGIGTTTPISQSKTDTHIATSHTTQPTEHNAISQKNTSNTQHTSSTESMKPLIITRSGRTVKPVERLTYTADMQNSMEKYMFKVSIKEALASSHNQQAWDSIKGEIEYMIKYKVLKPIKFDLIPREDLSNIIPAFMFLKHKYFADGTFDKIKARLVAGGHKQTEDTYDQTTSPTINPITVMILLNIMTILNLESRIIDIKGAFLSAPWKPGEPIIYIKLPKDVSNIWVKLYPEYNSFIHTDGHLYVRVYKYIYGLKQASRKFNEHFNEFMIRNDFTKSISDECVYLKKCEKYMLIIGAHVDDLIILAAMTSYIDEFQALLTTQFDINSQESDTFSYLGLSIIRDRNRLITTVSQQYYLQAIIARYLPRDTRQRSSPMDISYPNTKNDNEQKCDKKEYLSLIMSLMYLARFTRPDILFSTTFLATKCESPTEADMNAAIKIVQYLKTTGNLAYTFSGTDIQLQFYIDASHGVHPDGRGHTAIAASFGSSPIITRSVKQKLVALHSTDAELYAVVEGLTYVIWIRVFLSELDFELEGPVPIHQDNKSAMLIYQNGGQFKRSKHLLVKQNYIKDLLTRGIADFKYLSTNNMPVDPMSKPVPALALQRMMNYFKIRSLLHQSDREGVLQVNN